MISAYEIEKYSDIAEVLVVGNSASFWSNSNIIYSLAFSLAVKGQEDYKNNSQLSPMRTIAETVAMKLADPKNILVKAEMISEIQKLKIHDFTEEKRQQLLDTINRGEEILRKFEEISNRSAQSYYDEITQTPSLNT